MRLRRLGWAGLEIEADGYRLVVDLLVDLGFYAGMTGEDREPLVRPDAGVDAALITHLHRDHADAPTLGAVLAPGAPVHRPRPGSPTGIDAALLGPIERELAELDHPLLVADPGDVLTLGPLRATAVDAVDGLGSPQVSWVVTDGRHTVAHAGDTLWHGRWWHVAQDHGPVDVAFLPANGPVVDFPVLQPTVTVPAAMSAEQAVDAARALQAAVLVPIHVDGTFKSERYVPDPGAEDRIVAVGRARDQRVELLAPGEWHEVGDLAGVLGDAG